MDATNKGQKYPAEIYTDIEVRLLLRACSSRADTGVRNRALISLLYRGGLRINEALHLLPKDLDREAGSVRVLQGKGRKARTIGLDPGAFAVIERWIDLRIKRGINGRQRLFCTLRGRPLATAYIRALLPRLAVRAGIDKRVHAHGLRHTHAAQLAGEGVPISVIQMQLGHSSSSTTARYLNHIAPQQVIDTISGRTWSL